MEDDSSITCTDNGPYKVTGVTSIRDADGNEIDIGERTTLWLCRCGESSNKPFCDGAHKEIGFEATERAE